MFNWQYTIDLPVPGDEILRVSFDDWMWLLSEDRLLNRAYMRRFGVPIGEVILFFRTSLIGPINPERCRCRCRPTGGRARSGAAPATTP